MLSCDSAYLICLLLLLFLLAHLKRSSRSAYAIPCCPSVSQSVHLSVCQYIHQVHWEVSICMGVCLSVIVGLKTVLWGLQIDKNGSCGVKDDQRKIKRNNRIMYLLSVR